MADLNGLVMFARVLEAGSFSEAARRMRLPVSTISRRITDLENLLGVRLLERSTRSLRVTDMGAEVLEHARQCMALGETVDAMVAEQRAEVSGLLSLSAPPSISDTLLAPLLQAFQKTYPHVRVQVLVTDRFVDHIGERVDLVFRRGALEDSSLVTRAVLSYRHRLVASPAYLTGCRMPRHPQDLLEHRLLAFSHWRPRYHWTFMHTGTEAKETLTIKPYLAMNDYNGLAAALVAGAGIGDLPPIVQPELLREGKLVEVMPDWRFRAFDLSLVHLGNRHILRQVRAFLDFAVRMLPELFPDLPN